MSIKLAVFDMAGTTVEDRDFVHQALIDAFKVKDIVVLRGEVNAVMGYPKPIAILTLLKEKTDFFDEKDTSLVYQVHEIFVDNMVQFYRHDRSVKAKDGAEETFESLRKRGIKIALDTGFDRKIANTIIERLGWNGGMIDLSVTSDEVENGRPYPDMIFEAMKLSKVKHPEYVIKIGDTISDLQEGKAAGCRYVVGITTGAFSRQELINEYHTHLIDDLRQVLDII